MNNQSTKISLAAFALGCMLIATGARAAQQDALSLAFGEGKTLFAPGGFQARGLPAVADHRWPDTDRGSRRSGDSAFSICRDVWESAERDACESIARRARFFPDGALPLCRMLRLDRDKVACLGAIADHEISRYEAESCGNRRDDVEMLNCLRQAGRGYSGYPDHRGYPDRRGYPDHASPHSGRGLDAAFKVCEDIFSDSSKMSCMKAVRRARYFSTDAVNVCGDVFSDDSKVECLERIQDKSIDPRVARMCGNLFGDSEKIRCLGDNY
jgi:hypothetical protein